MKTVQNLDRTDRKILRVLQKDGRIANVDLARTVNLTPTPCLERVKRLEKEGFITGYVADSVLGNNLLNLRKERFLVSFSLAFGVKLLVALLFGCDRRLRVSFSLRLLRVFAAALLIFLFARLLRNLLGFFSIG